MKKTAGISIPSGVIITLVYALLAAIFLELDNASGDDIYINDNNSNKTSLQELVETPCKSLCPSTAEMCIQMCA